MNQFKVKRDLADVKAQKYFKKRASSHSLVQDFKREETWLI